MNNKGCFGIGTIGLVLIGIVLVLFFWGKGVYNTLVTKDQDVQSKWSNIETVYQKEQI